MISTMRLIPRRFIYGILWFGITASMAVISLGGLVDTPTVSSVESKIAELGDMPVTDDGSRASAIDILKGARDLLKRANDFSNKASEFRQLSNDAPQVLASIREELRLPPSDPVVVVPDGTPLTQIELTHNQASATLQAARLKIAELQAETERRDQQRSILTERLVQVKQELIDIRSQGEPTVQPETPNEVADARALLYQSSIIVRESEIEAIDRELESYEIRRELLPARRDRAQRRAAEAQSLVDAWQLVIVNRRQIEAEQTIIDAKKLRREAARQHPVLKKFAEESVAFANTLVIPQATHGIAENYAQRLARARTELETLESKFLSIQNRLNASGLNRATGLLLRNQYETIPDISELRKEADSIRRVHEDLDYTLIELQEERVQAGDIDQVAQSLIMQMPSDELMNERPEVLLVAKELATARRDLLDKLIGDATNNLMQLVELDATLARTTVIAQSYTDYVEERILWVRSIARGRGPSAIDFQESINWIASPESWDQAFGVTKAYIATQRIRVFAGVSLLLMLLLTSIYCRRWINTLGDQVSRFSSDSFRYTIFAFLLTAVMAAPIATTLLFLGWLLRAPEGQVEIARAVGSGMYAAAFTLYPLAFFRHLLRTRGLAITHFKWSKDSAIPIRKNLKWFIPIIVPIVLFVTTIDVGGDESANASLGRVLFTAQLLFLTLFLHKVLRPNGAVLGKNTKKNTNDWIYRSRYIWYLLAVLLPLVFIILSWWGFHYTALQLQSRLVRTLIFILVLVTVNAILHRWLYVARRRVAVEDAKRRRAQAVADAEGLQGTLELPGTPAATLDEERVDLPALSEQTRQIFRTSIAVSAIIGFFIIWAQALPALKMFDLVQVWPSVQILEDPASSSVTPQSIESIAHGPVQAQPENSSDSSNPMTGLMQPTISSTEQVNKEVVTVTVADIGISLIILAATWIAFRNIPGLIEIVVLQRLPLDAGSRYALSTVIRYLIAIMGILIAFRTIGIAWSNVQWLAAALTFGLAFGLQEIFANFVSGLIILAERPIRLGDTVTVGDTSGTVMRIRMRATTISDWNRKELVIPNKTFITSDVINWTLTDPTLRVTIPVGVSYSSDVDRVEKLLYEIASSCKMVLEDPKPQVLFKEFGDSTLNFELRVFIPHIDYFVLVRHEVHNTIFKIFKKEGVEIAFPQRDLHLRSVGDLAQLIDHKEKPEVEDTIGEPPAS